MEHLSIKSPVIPLILPFFYSTWHCEGLEGIHISYRANYPTWYTPQVLVHPVVCHSINRKGPAGSCSVETILLVACHGDPVTMLSIILCPAPPTQNAHRSAASANRENWIVNCKCMFELTWEWTLFNAQCQELAGSAFLNFPPLVGLDSSHNPMCKFLMMNGLGARLFVRF